MKQESTHEFVEKLHDKQAKDKKNKEKQGSNDPTNKLPTDYH
ncbi:MULTISPECIES: DUF4023 domain-containing protein [Bacillaceae]